MRVNTNNSDTMSPTQAAEPIIGEDNLQVENHAGPPPESSLNSVDVNPVAEDNVDPGKMSKIPDLIDEYFDSYSVGQDVPPIFLEKGLELSDLGISDEESTEWHKISSDSAIESGIHCSDCVEFMRNNMKDGRHFIGIEISEEYWTIAMKQIEMLEGY